MKLSNRHILILILAVAAVLRFWNYFAIPFTHDEFSAFFRTGYWNFFELIEKGVKTDTHPAGVQVFMNYWMLLFGESPWVVKLPFTLMGLGAVYLIWKLGVFWYNQTVGLIAAAFMASLQFTVMYSQIARPYISGLFLTLLLVWYWSQLVQQPQKRFWKNGIAFTLVGALCAYNHHFTLLFAAIVGLSGLLFIKREFLLKYMLFGVGIFILYLPHMNIFLGQLAQGGVGLEEGWLAAPENDFLWQFIRYVFHYSWLLLGIVFILVLLSILNKGKDFTWKKFGLFTAWFLIPFFIGFFYSKYKNPVIQYSVLMFSFPYLFFLLFGQMKAFKTHWNLIISIGIIALSTITLISNRQHFDLFYNSPYKALLQDQDDSFKSDNTALRIIDSYPKMNRYYNRTLDIDTSYYKAQNFTTEKDFISFIEAHHHDHDRLFFGAYSRTNPLFVPIIQGYYPFMSNERNYEGGKSILFSKRGEIPVSPEITSLDFSSLTADHWRIHKDFRLLALKDSVNDVSFGSMNQLSEYSPSYEIDLSELEIHPYDFIDIQVDMKIPNDSDEVILVAQLMLGDDVIHWSGTDIQRFNSNSLDWFKTHHSVNTAFIKENLSDLRLKTYVWNKSRTTFYLDNYKVKIRKGNPKVYGLYNELESDKK